MTTETKLPTVAEIKEFFFAFAMKCFVDDLEFGGDDFSKPKHSHYITHLAGPFFGVDRYRREGEFFSGEMQILLPSGVGSTLLWTFQRHGWCKADAGEKHVAFLKE